MKIRYMYVLLLLVISFLPLINLFYSGLPITHDGQDHVARIANFYKNLEEGNVIPRWAANLNWGYGHPILMFLYPLPSYLASFFHFLGFSFTDSTKLVFGSLYILSGFSMYLFIKEIFGSRSAAFVAAVLYLFAPYRFVDLYVRGAIGEHAAFAFAPFVFYFITKLIKKIKPFIVIEGGISLTLLILSHNAISLMFLPVMFLYAVYVLSLSKEKQKVTLALCGIIFIGFSLASFFWIPAFFEGKYTLRDKVTSNEYATRFVDPYKLLYSEWNYGISGQFSPQVGIPHWVVFLLSIPVFVTLKKKKEKVLLLGSMAIFLSSLFIMTRGSHFVWQAVSTLEKFQFPWRFLTVTVFIASFVGGLLMMYLGKYKTLYVVFICVLSVVLTSSYWKAKDYLFKSDSFFSSVYNGSTDTGESAPIWSIRFMEKRPKARVEIISGPEASIEEVKRKSTEHVYVIDTSEKIKIQENTLFFPGWEVFIDEKSVPIQFQDPNSRGIITFYVDPGKHVVSVRFRETKLRFIADLISLITATCIILFIVGGVTKKAYGKHIGRFGHI